MLYQFCLSEKLPSSMIVSNVYRCDTVMPDGFDTSMYQYVKSIDSNDHPEIQEIIFGVPDYWVFDFSQPQLDVRLYNETENLIVSKIKKRKEIQNYWELSRVIGSEYCYCETTVYDVDNKRVVVSCSFDDIINLECIVDSLASNTDTDYINDINGNDILLSRTNINKIVREMNNNMTKNHRLKRLLYSQISAATNVASLDLIVWPVRTVE